MSFLNIGKKLLPAGKALKGITSTLQAKLHKLKRSKSIKKATTRLGSTLSTFLPHRYLRSSPHHRDRKKPRLQTPTTLRPHRHYNHLHQSFAPVYIDDLFNEPASAPVKLVEPPPSTSKAGEKSAAPSASVVVDGPKASAAAAELQLWGVDERAERFIAKFKEDMRLQRQRSFGEYQEMLTRGM
ncbi:uncharacterized protein LOC131238651 [Magnolia sinica]|uniref:uncharacterized protein LOC131238651 n=1 Tax=Magnolia sinica TaxID=86752 RepID=UPI002658EC5C|nr:uncharacterized protein LOC131238651 [Magnolia sinica]